MSMQLNQKDIEEFKAIYEKEFNEKITMTEAEHMAHDVMNLFEAIYEDRVRQWNTKCLPSPAQAHTPQPNA